MFKVTEKSSKRGRIVGRVFSTLLMLALFVGLAGSAGAQGLAIDYSSVMPPIADQGEHDQGFVHNPSSTIVTNRSSVAWATIYNYGSSQMTADSGATSLSLPQNILSPYFTYDQGGNGQFELALESFLGQGAATMDVYPAVGTELTSDVLASAAKNKIVSYEAFFENEVEVQSGVNGGANVFASTYDNDVEVLKRWLVGTAGRPGDAFVMGLPVFESFLAASEDTGSTVTYSVDPLNLTNDAFTGKFHAVCVIGYDDSLQAFRIVNTWGSDWGSAGYKWVSYDFVNKYADQAWHMKYAARPAVASNPSPSNGTTYVPLTANLQWGGADLATSYDVYLWTGVKPAVPTAADLTASQYDIPGDLDLETQYSWQVVAKNASGATEGPVWTFTTTPDLHDITPPAITGTVTVKATDTTAIIKWTTNEPATGVVVVQPGNITASQVGLSTAHIIEVEGLTALTEYTVTVSSVDASNNGPTTAEVTFTTGNIPDLVLPQFKGLPTITQITDRSAFLSFQTNEPVKGSVVILGAGGGSYTIDISDLTSVYSAALTGLAANTTYTVTVSLTDARGNGPLVAILNLITDLAPDRTSPEFESGPYAVDLSDDAVTIRFETNEFCTARVIVENATTRVVSDSSPATAFSVRMVGLTGGAAALYTARVIITDLAGNGPVVSSIVFTTRSKPDTDPPVISQVRPGASPNNISADITWVTDEGATSLVKYGTTPALGEEETFDGVDITHLVTLTGLLPATKYYYQVFSSDAIGNGPASSAIMEFETDYVSDAFSPVVTDAKLVLGNQYANFVVYSDEPARMTVRYRVAGTSNAYQEKVALLFRQASRVKLTGLSPNTAYDFRISLSDEKGNVADVTADVSAVLSASSGNLSASADGSSLFVTNLFPDTTPPVVSAIEVLSISDSSAVVRWTTDEVSDSRLVFGVQGDILSEPVVDSRPLTEHVLVLNNLDPQKVYAFQIVSVDLAGNPSAASVVNTFTTAATPDVDAPVFTVGPVAAPGTYKATISWVTNELATSEVNFGVDPTSLRKVAGVGGLSLEHAVTLTNLTPGTLYYAKAITVDTSGNRSTALIEMRTNREAKTIVVGVLGNGSVTLDPAAAQYAHGSVVTMTAVPAVGSHFVAWTGLPVDQLLTNPVGVVMTENYEVTATFAVNRYALNVTAVGGTVDRAPESSTYEHGSQVVLTAVPSVGYSFAGWTGSGVPAGADVNDPELALTMNAAKDIVANFAINAYALNITAANGTVTADPAAVKYAHGTVVALSAVPAPGFHFNGWTGDVPVGQEMANPLVLTVTAVTNVTADFQANAVGFSALTVLATNGSVTPSAATYENGTEVTLTATPDEGYVFTGWTGDAIGTDNPLTMTVNKDMVITATFAIKTYTLDVTTENGTVIADPAVAPYNHGTVVALSAVPDTGYHFIGWSGDGVTTDTAMANPITVTMLSDMNMTASFEANAAGTHTITVFTANGTVTMDPAADSYAAGTDVTLTATPDAGFYFAGWTGAAVTSVTAANNPLVLTVDADTSLTAVFTAGQAGNFTLTLLAVDGSVARTPDPATYAPGTEVTISATPMPTYHFTGWTGDISTATAMLNPAQIVMDGNKVITATFAINTYPGPVVTAVNGSVSIDPVATAYNYGDVVTLSAVAAMGYDFTGWTGDVPTGMETANPLTLTIDGALNLTAVFTPKSFAVTVQTDTNGSVNQFPAAVTYFYGTVVTLIAIPADGFHFSHWTGDVPVGMEEVNPLVLNINGPVTIMANFARDYSPATGSYLVTYKNATLVTDANGLTFEAVQHDWDTSEEALVKIKSLKKGLPAGVTPDENGFAFGTKSGQAYLVKGLLKSVVINGSARTIYSEIPIGTLTVTGFAKSLTTKNAHVQNIDVDGFKSVKMTSAVDSTNQTNPFIASTSIISGAYTQSAKIALVGVVLDGLDAPSLSMKSITTTGKKLKDKVTKQKYGSFGGVEGDIMVRDLKKITAKAASINADSIKTDAFTKSMKITAKAGVIAATTGDVVVGGDISSDIVVDAYKLTVDAKGGNITSAKIITTGEIGKLSAKSSKLKVNGVKNYVGGELGIELSGAQTPYSLFVSGSDVASPKKDIKKVYGSVAIKGVFMAGATVDSGTVTPTRAAALVKVSTDKPGKVPGVLPAALGEYYSNNTAKVSGGDFTLFEKK